MATVMQYMHTFIKCTSTTEALLFGATLWVGFALPLNIVAHVHNPKSKKVIVLLDLSYQLTYFLVQSAVIHYFTN